MFLKLVVFLLPIIYLIGNIFVGIGKKRITPISNVPIFIFVVIMALAMGSYEVPEFSDRAQYMDLYMYIYNNTYHGEYKDIGWQFFVTLCTYIFSDNVQMFFIFVSFIYCFSYYYFARHKFEVGYEGYFIILSFGCLGFSGYGTNTIRAGMAIGFALIALTIERNNKLRMCLAFFSISLHLSMILPIFCFIVAHFIKGNRYPYYAWIICLLLSIINFDISPFIGGTDAIDSRFNQYANMVTDSYESGYRVDFLIYSIIPMLIVYLFNKRSCVLPDLYHQLYRTYILTNAFWLLVIRMPYTNRIAYLSWMIIPYLLLYPIIYNRDKIKSSKTLIHVIMILFMGVNIALSLRDMFIS